MRIISLPLTLLPVIPRGVNINTIQTGQVRTQKTHSALPPSLMSNSSLVQLHNSSLPQSELLSPSHPPVFLTQ